MAHFMCIIQRDQAAHLATDRLESGLRTVYSEQFEAEPTTVSWQVVSPGEMFTAGRQSTSSIVGCVLSRTTTLAEREQFMRAICRLWTDTTGCTDHEVVVAIAETEPATV
ncbi:MAG: hypothetical protein K0U75_16560 [Actinomycetia bacterium]|nr:hypothetical protein [Actinomycetes bacterium]